jgi:hypothetical protein
LKLHKSLAEVGVDVEPIIDDLGEGTSPRWNHVEGRRVVILSIGFSIDFLIILTITGALTSLLLPLLYSWTLTLSTSETFLELWQRDVPTAAEAWICTLTYEIETAAP